MSDASFDRLWNMLEESWQAEELESFSLTGPDARNTDLPRKSLLRPVVIGGKRCVQWTSLDAKKHQTHQNHDWPETCSRLRQLLGNSYASAYLKTIRDETQIQLLNSGKVKFKTIKRANVSTAAVTLAHNTSKQYLFPEGVPCPFLVATGIMTESGQVRASLYRKFRQINRFAEFVYDLREHFPRDRPVRVVDYGCGKSYLTFAVRHLLVEVLGLSVEMLGLDTNPAVIHACNETRKQLNLTDLEFQTVRIAEATLAGPLDLAIWLHACDTATDEALARSLELQAGVILAAPCCQHELHHQLENETWQPVLKHGILRERLAALTTDALRAQLLEAHGYRTQIMEFIDLEHTAKNLLLRSIRKPASTSQQEQDWAAYLALKQELHVDHFELEKRLGKPV